MPRPGMKFKDDAPESGGVVKKGSSPPDVIDRFDWRKERYRVLVAPQRDYSISISHWKEEHTSYGGVVTKPFSIPFDLRVLTGGDRDLLGYGDLALEDVPDPGADGDIQHETRGAIHELPEITAGSELVNPAVQRRIQLWGCQLRITPEYAEQFGTLFIKKDGPQEPFEALVAAIVSRKRPFSLYGKKYAFIDDKDGMRGLMGRFADYARKASWDRDDVTKIFELNDPSMAKVGPPLSKFEPERFEINPKTGRPW